MLHTFLSVFIICLIFIGIEGFGVGPDEIYARVNDSFRISCSVPRAQGKLNFYDDDDMIPASYIKRINDTFIEMIMAYQRPVKKNLTCRQGRNNVGYSEVIVDQQMATVTDFKCRTHNLTIVLCSFRKPNAFLPIRYRFSVGVNEEPKNQLRLRQDGQSGYSANIKVSQFTSYLENATIALKIEANNTFYRLDEAFNYSLMEILTPSAVNELKVMEDLTTHSSVFTTFALPKALKNASQAMMFDVRLKVNDESSEWNKITNPRLQLTGGEGYLVLDHLEYANTNYAMKIRIKAKKAEDVDEMWSPFKEVHFKTSPKLPETAPKTCDNCFNVMDNGNVVVYWMEVPAHYQNAGNFSYLARGWDEQGGDAFNASFDQTSMLVTKDLISKALRIELLSVNERGVSEKFSQLSIRPEHLESNKKLLKIRKELIDGSYKITWRPLEPLDIESFTVVWCRQRNELPNQCDGSIKFQNLPATASEFQLHASNSFQFGVAVNYRNQSLGRGFEWAECTAAKSNEIGQVHSLWSSVLSEKSIILHWSLNCADEPIVVGYNITYCSVDDNARNQCNEAAGSEIVILNDKEELNQYELLNLKSYQLYSISVALMSLTRLGISSSPIVARTMEGPPTAPRNLQPIQINRHSIDLSWNLPLEVNGESMTYQLWYNDHKVNINDNNTMNETFAYKLENLESFTNYTITIVACTSDCSASSDSITLRTAMGEPSVMLQPKLNNLSEGKRILSWDNPLIVGGNLDYFQLKMIPSQSYENGEEKVFRVNGRAKSCFIEGFKCDKANVLFAIRGVNIEHREESFQDEVFLNQTVNCFAIAEPIVGEVPGHFYGGWSVPIIYPCQPQMSLVMIASVIITAISMMTSVYLFVRLYQRYKEMKDIHIVWPKGLDPNEPSPQVPHRDVYEAVKDFDLIKDHVLTDVEEEEDIAEREKFIQINSKPEGIAIVVSQRESAKSEALTTEATNKMFYQMPKPPNQTKSAPTSPERNANAYTEFPSNSHVDSSTEYTKMYAPQKPSIAISSSVDGYMDMTGKMPVKLPPSARSAYTLNEVKLFIRDSETNNNGYIGKRASILMDPQQKRPPLFISDGYVGVQPK